MNKYLVVMAGVALMMVWSCGGKTNEAVLQTDSLAVDSVKAVADSVTAEPKSDDVWTETAVEARVKEIYKHLNKELSKNSVDMSVFDKMYCSEDYKDLYKKVLKAEEGKNIEEMCFLEYRPWDFGLVAPIKVSNIRPELLTGDMAEVFFDLKDAEGTTITAGWTLYLEDGAWKVHNFHTRKDDQGGMWDHMMKYLEE